jgi:hypothetical protein
MSAESAEVYWNTKLFSSCSPYDSCQEESADRYCTTSERHANVTLYPTISMIVQL